MNDTQEQVREMVEVGTESIAEDMIDSMPDPTNLLSKNGNGEKNTVPDSDPPSPAKEGKPQKKVKPPKNGKIEKVIIDPENPPDDYDPFRFDPRYHQKGPTGKGVLNKDKTYRRHGGRPKRTAAKSVVNISPPEQLSNHESITAEPENVPVSEAALVGKTAVHLTVAVGAFIGKITGDDGSAWQPTPDESISLEQAYTTYFDSIGFQEISPLNGLLMALGLFIAPRMMRPKPMSMWKKLCWKVGFAVKRIFKRGGKNAHVDSGDNLKRQEYGSETDNPAL